LVTCVAELERACWEKGVKFRYGRDVTREPQVFASYDRVVFPTGVRYRYGLERLVPILLNTKFVKSALARRLFSKPRLRKLLYYRIRAGTGPDLRCLAGPGQKVEVIGDAERASKARDAIDGAFRTVLLADQERARDGPGQDGQLQHSEGSASKYVTQLLAWQRLNKG
jgi:hypothetical protein